MNHTKIKLTDAQDTAMRSAWGSWQGYATDPFRHDNIDSDENYDKNCEEQDDVILSEYVSGVVGCHPELAGKEDELKEWMQEF